MNLPAILHQDVPYGSRVLVRASLNAPLENGEVSSMFRLQQTVRTLEFLKKRGARITVIGHIGREGESLAPIHKALNKLLPISFLPSIVGEAPFAARAKLQPGEIVLLENTRKDPREETGDILFAEELGAQTDMFVFDDFTAAHRAHASTTELIKLLPAYAGIRFYEEVTALLRITERRTSPSIAILGGAKCKTKLPLIEKLLETYNVILVGGVLATTLLKQKGYSVGMSKTEEINIPENILQSTKILLPQEVVVTKDFNKARTVEVADVADDDTIVDVSDNTLKTILYQVQVAKTVVWNGPLGWFEKGFFKQTLALSQYVKEIPAYTFAGGGDTAAFLEQHNMLNNWEFVSTGGGSSLTYLAGTKLPVLQAFEEKMLQKQR